MSKRRAWTDAQPITAADLTDIGNFTEENIGELAIASGPGRLNGLIVTQTATASTQVIVSPGRALIQDPSVGRPRLVTLMEPFQPSFTGRSSGDYAVIVTAQERDEDLRTIVPPPPNHPFFEPGMLAHDFSTGKRWVAGISVQAMPYTPTGAQAILAIVSWNGASVTNAQITPVLDYPIPLIATGGLHPRVIGPGLAGRGISRANDGSLNILTDDQSLKVVQDSAALGSSYRLSVGEGGITDYHLGTRLLTPLALPNTANVTDTHTNLIRYLAGAVAGITGKTSWNLKPETTLNELAANVTRRGVNEVIVGRWGFTFPVSVADAQLPDHAINKRGLDAAIALVAGDGVNSLKSHRTAAVLDHPDASVTDAKIGPRTIRYADNLPTGGTFTGELTPILNILARVIKDMKGTTEWYTTPSTTLTQISERVNNVEKTVNVYVPGSITDVVIGDRTVNPDLIPTGNTGSITELLSFIVNRIRAITGNQNWTDNPSTTIAELDANVARKNRNEVIVGSWTFQVPVIVPTPTQDTHAVNRGWVSQAIAGATGSTLTSIQNLTQQITNKSDVGHTHSWTEITNKPTTLESFGIIEAISTEIGGYNPGRPPASEVILAWVASRKTTIKAANPGRARALTAAAATTTFLVELNGNQVGSVIFPAGSSTGNISVTGDIVLQPGSILSVRAPANADTTLADIAVTFAGVY